MSRDFMADALPKRPSQKTSRYVPDGGFSSSLDSTRVTVTDNKTGGKYVVPQLEGDEFDTMRRYGLVLARWSCPDIKTRAKKEGKPIGCYESANRVVANKMFAKAFGTDPTVGTVNLTPYINAINTGKITPGLIHGMAGFIGTEAYDKVLSSISKTPEGIMVHEKLSELAKVITTSCLDPEHYYGAQLDGLHSGNRNRLRRAKYTYDYMAALIDDTADEITRKSGKDKKPKRKGESKKPSAGKPAPLPEEQGWCKPFLAKYPLELPHTGKLGRRLIATNEGKNPKNFHRLVTDPFRRIFVRKTRSLGGVVVFDCSGSMGLSTEQIKQVLKSSAGCSILCYSDHGDPADDEKFGNMHLVARNGRQMRGLPDFPGGNGVDLPALRYGYDHLRLNGRSPVIWVSDGQVTGSSGGTSRDLRKQTMAYIEHRKIHWVENPEEAIALLTKLQRGIRK